MTRRVPEPLQELGEVFVHIPPGEKGTRQPRTPENLHNADDPVLQAHLENDINYGVTTRKDLVVLDADEPSTLQDVINELPDTAWQENPRGEEVFENQFKPIIHNIPADYYQS